MDKNEVLKMAEQAGWSGIYSQWVSPTERTHLTVPVTMEQIEAFVKLVEERTAAKEREKCWMAVVQVAESNGNAYDCIDAILDLESKS